MYILCVRVKNAMGKGEVEQAKGIREVTGGGNVDFSNMVPRGMMYSKCDL